MLLKKLIAGIAFLFAGILYADAHPIHVSVCNIEFTPEESIISVKFYSDDFSTVIQNHFNKELNLEKAGELPHRDHITAYIHSNLQVFVNRNKVLKLIYAYSELDEESIWLYFTVNNTRISGNIRIINTLMLDLFEDQTNLLIINYEGKQNGYRFNHGTTELDIRL